MGRGQVGADPVRCAGPQSVPPPAAPARSRSPHAAPGAAAVSSSSRAECLVEIDRKSMSRQRADAEDACGALAVGPALRVLAVGQRVVRPGIDDQHGQSGRRRDRTGSARWWSAPTSKNSAWPSWQEAEAIWSISPHGTPTKSFSARWAILASSGRRRGRPRQRSRRQAPRRIPPPPRRRAGAHRHRGVQREVDRRRPGARPRRAPRAPRRDSRPSRAPPLTRAGGRPGCAIWTGVAALRRGHPERPRSSPLPAATQARASMANGKHQAARCSRCARRSG